MEGWMRWIGHGVGAALTMAVGLAAVGAQASSVELLAPTWESLTPWRTWVVLEHVDGPRDWFVVDKAAGGGQRCEIGVPRDSRPVRVWCGPRTLGAEDVRPVDRAAKAARKTARDALIAHLGADKKAVPSSDLQWMGTLSRVSFRQVVPVGDGPGAHTPARTASTSWDVEENGRVHRSAIAPLVRVTAVCAPGIHPDCDGSPTLLPYEPTPSMEGHLVGEDADPGTVAALEKAVAAAAAGHRAPSARAGDGSPLPPAYRDLMVLQLQVQGVDARGESGEGRFDVDVDLRQAADKAVRLSLPVGEMPAVVELDVDVPAGTLTVRVRPAQERFVEHTLGLTCHLLKDPDDGAVALPGRCQIDSDGRWLRWQGARGSVMVQVAPDAGPRMEGGDEPGVRRQEG